jgi:hypothetical protein
MIEREASFNQEDDTLSEENKEVRDLLLLWLDYIMQLPENEEFVLKLVEENEKKAFHRE